MANKSYKILLFYCLVFYLAGFMFKDLTPTGAKGDFYAFTWVIIQDFKKDFFNSIINFGQYGDASYPFFYIFNSYLNPFSKTIFSYHLSTTITGLVTFLLFAMVVKREKNLDKLSSLALASTILLLPFFISRNYWGTSSFLAWLTFIISINYFLLVFNNSNNRRKFINTILFCFFSSISIYIKPYFIFFSIFFLIKIFMKEELNLKILTLLLYSIFSLPGFYLIYTWGGIIATDAQNSILDPNNHIHPQNFLRNLIIIPTIFLFYFVPIFIHLIFQKKFNLIFLNHLPVLLISFILLICLDIYGFFDYLKYQELGGGAILKLNKLIINDYLYLFLIATAAGLSIIYNLIKFDPKNNFTIIALIFVIFGLPKILYQDYLEPLLIFLIYTNIINNDYLQLDQKNTKTFTLISVLFYSLYLISSVLYKKL